MKLYGVYTWEVGLCDQTHNIAIFSYYFMLFKMHLASYSIWNLIFSFVSAEYLQVSHLPTVS